MKITFKKIIWAVVILIVAFFLFDIITNPDDFVQGIKDGWNAYP
ncbi:MAG: DUF350 domain-containing protein [Bacteroidota bacterium]